MFRVVLTVFFFTTLSGPMIKKALDLGLIEQLFAPPPPPPLRPTADSSSQGGDVVPAATVSQSRAERHRQWTGHQWRFSHEHPHHQTAGLPLWAGISGKGWDTAVDCRVPDWPVCRDTGALLGRPATADQSGPAAKLSGNLKAGPARLEGQWYVSSLQQSKLSEFSLQFWPSKSESRKINQSINQSNNQTPWRWHSKWH